MFCQLELTDTPGLYRCKVCGNNLPDLNTDPPDKVYFPCPSLAGQPLPKPLPPKWTRFTNFSKALARFVASPKTVTKEQFEERLNICKDCVWRNKNHCSVCGCKLSGLMNKPKLKTENCPLGKWPSPKAPMNKLIFKNDFHPVDLENLFKGGSCFFIGGGPSLLENLPATQALLASRGVLTAAVNNIAARHIRPNIWISVDNPSSFSDVIFKDPAIMKFVAEENYNKNFLDTHNGKKEASKTKVSQCPNTFYFPRNKDFDAQKFLTEPTVNWGNHTDIVDSEGNKGGRSVMLAAIKILYYLGFRRIYLLGCDFNMTEQQPYAFEQKKHAGGCKTNNQMYEIMDSRFKVLRPILEKNKCIIKNCTPNSKLTAFDHISLQQAVTEATNHIPKKVDLSGMYGGK